MKRRRSRFKFPTITIPPSKNPRRRTGVILTLLVALLSVNLVSATPKANAGSRPSPGFQCRAVVENIGSRAGSPQIIEPIRASNRCQGGIGNQSITVILQYWQVRRFARDGWAQVTKRTAGRRGPGPISVSTRWNCGDPHRNNAGRVRLRVVATGQVIDWNGDYHGASTLSRNEITRDCAV